MIYATDFELTDDERLPFKGKSKGIYYGKVVTFSTLKHQSKHLKLTIGKKICNYLHITDCQGHQQVRENHRH